MLSILVCVSGRRDDAAAPNQGAIAAIRRDGALPSYEPSRDRITEPPPPTERAGAELDIADGMPHPFDAEVRTLPNGMTAILVRDTSAATVATRIVVGAGAAHDPPGRAGTAHLLEHLMYGGTSRIGTLDWAAEQPHLAAVAEISSDLAYLDDAADRADLEEWMVDEAEAADELGLPNEVARLLDALGATEVNATTGLEATSFIATVPANALEPWAVLEAERFADPVIRTFVNERRVVQEELSLRSACGSTRTAQDERSVLFAGHPYAMPIGGTEVSVGRASVADVERFFEQYYVPSNMAVVLVGDLDVDATFALLADTLGGVPEGPAPSADVPVVEPAAIGLVAIPGEETPSGLSLLELSWALVGLAPGDVEAMRVAAHVVAVDPRVKSYWLGQVTIEKLTNAAILRISGPTRQSSEAISAVRSAIRRIAEQGVPAEALTAMQIGAWVARVEALERQQQQAADLASAWVRGDDHESLWTALVELRGLDRERVRDAVRRLWTPDDFTATTGPKARASKEKKKKKARSPAAVIDGADPRTSAFYDEVLAIPRPPMLPAWRAEGIDWTRTADGRVIAVRNPQNSLFQVTLSWPRGGRHNDTVCEALAQLVEVALSDPKLRRAGVQLRPFPKCGWESAAIQLKGPASGVDAAASWVARLRELTSLGRSLPSVLLLIVGDSPFDRRSLYARYGPPALVPFPRKVDTPPSNVHEQLAALRWLVGHTPDVRFAGHQDAAAVSALFPSGPRTERDAPPMVRPVTRRVQLWDGPSELGIVKVGEPYDPAHEGLYALYEHWLRGLTGVVAEELRIGTGKVYAFDVTLVRSPSLAEPNVLEVKIPSRHRSRHELVDLARRAADVVARDVLDDEAWTRLLEATRTHAMADRVSFRDAPRQIGEDVDRGLDVEAQEIAWRQLGEVTKNDFEEFLRQESRIPATIVIAGSALDPEDLRSVGRVEIVSD